MRTLGSRYVLHELLGQGTTGEVWRASRRDDGAAVAVKMLRPEFADDPVVVDRFLREWQILYDIDSPDLVRVLDLVNERDALAIVMELVEGTDLREYLRHEAPLPVDEAVRIVIDVLWALDNVHGAGVVHRDVKPENVLLESRGNGPAVRLTDFGIARMVDTLSRGRTPATGPIGTPLYMAPELGTSTPPTPAVDIYSAGIVLYELLAGMPPFDEANPADMLAAHREQEPLPIKGVPRPVWDVLAAMLAKSPAHRPPTAAEAARALESALRRDRDRDLDLDLDDDRRRNDDRDWDRREDTWERGVPDRRNEAGDAMAGAGGRRTAAAAAAGAGAGAALGMTKVAHAEAGQGGPPYGPGRGYPDDDWNPDAATGLMPPVPGPRPGGPRGGGAWDDDHDAPTGILPPVPGAGPGGPRRGWDDDDEPPTGGQPVRVPGRAGATQSDRNTVISAIPASRQPAPGGGGGRPPSQNNRQQRLKIAAGAALVVALIAGAGGWALAASTGGQSGATDTGSESSVGAPGVRSTPFVDTSGNIIDPAATAPYATVVNGTTVMVTPKSSASGASTKPGSPSNSTAAGAPTTSAAPTTPSTATVPNLIGQNVSDAQAAVADAGFTNQLQTQQKCFDSDTPIGEIQSQAPAAGSRADRSTTVSAVVAGDCVTVPNVVGMSVADAKSALESRGFAVGYPWGTCDYGTSSVTGQSPANGSRQLRSSWVNIAYDCKASPPPPSSPSSG
ncbi:MULTISPECIES: serine/threonine-protein kinase [unclassified Pseudofrankia]|uniref:serine/threonine-protein kinase n=1 Tax=unclassified Pseudofrankia TaxID=2994372 RepID=UPI0008DA26B9|nr:MULTISPECIES: serine/threonine-protein kinase [unclassified Pseudofrankia]MDT3443753.1 protein kinase [Pseudofrankia sp. BMG5.37]OHV50026.1 serine/threonine protein kinase [Pseudofrankia sp. BMG5.36]